MKWVFFLLMVIALCYVIYSARPAVQRQISSSTLSIPSEISPETVQNP